MHTYIISISICTMTYTQETCSIRTDRNQPLISSIYLLVLNSQGTGDGRCGTRSGEILGDQGARWHPSGARLWPPFGTPRLWVEGLFDGFFGMKFGWIFFSSLPPKKVERPNFSQDFSLCQEHGIHCFSSTLSPPKRLDPPSIQVGELHPGKMSIC